MRFIFLYIFLFTKANLIVLLVVGLGTNSYFTLHIMKFHKKYVTLIYFKIHFLKLLFQFKFSISPQEYLKRLLSDSF